MLILCRSPSSGLQFLTCRQPVQDGSDSRIGAYLAGPGQTPYVYSILAQQSIASDRSRQFCRNARSQRSWLHSPPIRKQTTRTDHGTFRRRRSCPYDTARTTTTKARSTRSNAYCPSCARIRTRCETKSTTSSLRPNRCHWTTARNTTQTSPTTIPGSGNGRRRLSKRR
jgi:hypothetical protein